VVIVLKDGSKILVAYDGSDYAKRAIEEAAEVTKKFSGSMTVLHVPWEESDNHSHNILAGATQDLRNTGIKYNTRSERDANIPRRILRIASEESYDLIVIGSRGMGGAKAWLLGSVANVIVNEATCPVLIVR
jgi:nucleotide-binding universal stress UspA family protein